MLQAPSIASGSVFEMFKHGSVVIGCWNNHWSVHLLERQMHCIFQHRMVMVKSRFIPHSIYFRSNLFELMSHVFPF